MWRGSTYLTWLIMLTLGTPSAEQVAMVDGQMPSRQRHRDSRVGGDAMNDPSALAQCESGKPALGPGVCSNTSRTSTSTATLGHQTMRRVAERGMPTPANCSTR